MPDTCDDPPAPPVRRRWFVPFDRPTAVVAGLIAAGLAYRGWLLGQGVPPTNSDEATMGLAALHIMEGTGFPAFFYGQAYMGTLEAYLAAPLFWLAGPSTGALRAQTLLFFLAFAAGLYVLARLLYGPWLAVVTTAVLALGSDRVIKNQLIAAGGYPEISPGAVALLLIAVLIGLGRARPRLALFAVLGLISGLLFWTHWLILPYLAAATAVLIAAWRRTRPPGWPALAATAGGLLLGALPLLVHNLSGPLAQNSVSVFLRQNGAGAAAPVGEHLYGGILFGIPMAVGLCSPGQCRPWQLAWTVPYLLLLVAAGVLAARGLARAGDGAARFTELARLALVGAAALSIAAYARSSAAAATPVESARYLSPLLISTPAVLWPLWSLAAAARRRLGAGRPRVAGAAAGYAPVAALLATMVAASAALVLHSPRVRRAEARPAALAEALAEHGITRIYSDYWTCNRLTFATRERVVCAVLADSLRPGLDRYRPYREQVARSERPAYVAPTKLELDARLRAWLDASGVPYETTTVDGYHVYLPAHRVPTTRQHVTPGRVRHSKRLASPAP